jgi:hypothetical protein
MTQPSSERTFVVAVDCNDVGLAITDPNGFQFVASHPDMQLLDGSRFRRLEQVQRAAAMLSRTVNGRRPCWAGVRPARAC